MPGQQYSATRWETIERSELTYVSEKMRQNADSNFLTKTRIEIPRGPKHAISVCLGDLGVLDEFPKVR